MQKTIQVTTITINNVLENKSRYIYWMSHPATIATGKSWGSTANNTAFANLTANVTVSLSGGVDGTITTANVITAYDSFDDAESVDIALVVSGPASQQLQIV
jgi:hypothetical protein